MRIYKLFVTQLLVCSLFLNSMPVIAGSQSAAGGSGSSATVDEDTKIATDYQTCKKMLANYNKCSVDNPAASPLPSGTPSENSSLKSCQQSSVPSFIRSCAYCANGSKWDEKFEDSDCEQVRTKGNSTSANFADNSNGTSTWEYLFLAVTAYGGVSDSICLASGGPGGMQLIDMWIHASTSLVYLSGEIVLLLRHQKALGNLSELEDKAFKDEKSGSINDVDSNKDTQLQTFKDFKSYAEETKTAYNTKRNLMYVVGVGYGLAAVTSIVMAFTKLFQSSNPVTAAAAATQATAEGVVLSRCGVLNTKASNTPKVQPEQMFSIESLKALLSEKIIPSALAAGNKQDLIDGWGLLTKGIVVAVLAAAFLLRKSLNVGSYITWFAGNFWRSVIYLANSALAFKLALDMKDKIKKLEDRIDVLNGIIAKLEKMNNAALGIVEDGMGAVNANLNLGVSASINNSGLAAEAATSIKYSSKSVLDTPEGVDCSKNSNPAECKKTVTALATQLNSTFSDANMGSLNMAIDSAKLSPLVASTLKGGVSGLKSVAMGLGGKNAIGIGNKFVDDFDKKIKDQKLSAVNALNAKLVKDGKAAIDFDGDAKKQLASVQKAEGDLSASQRSDLAASGFGGLPASSGPTTVTPARELNVVEAPTMATTTAEASIEESIGGDSFSASTDEQLPTTPKVFTEKSFDNFVNEVKERKHDRADADSLFSILNKAYKRNAYPVLLKPKKDKNKVKVEVPLPQS